MSRRQSEERPGLSPIQRKACLVLALCVLAVVLSFVASWILPQKLGLFGGSDLYDPTQYPLDTSLDAILGQESAQGNYINDTVFVGGTQAVSMSKDSSITLNQYAGQDGLKVSQVLRETCVNFADDANSYTIPQAIAKMKPLHVYIMVGGDDLDGTVSVDEFINDYKQIMQSIKTAYSACDVVACAIAPVSKGADDSAQKQTYIDQYNQQLAVACNDMGFKYLNLAEVLKNDKGYAVDSYVEASTGAFSGSGVNAVLDYVKNHAHNVDDTRGDRGDIPQRAASASSSGTTATPTPSPTPNKLTASYRVENGKGTLTSNDQKGVSSLDLEVASGTQVSVTAVPADGYTFYKWSDGVTDATRYDIINKDVSVTAMFNDSRVDLTLDRGDSTIKKGESISITATVKLGGKDYSNADVQWSVNDELEQNGGTFTFTGSNAGEYTIKAGIEINGTFSSAQLKVTVQADPTSISVSGTDTITAGNSVTLTANVQNASGDVQWSCEETSWKATGSQATFTANQEGTYHIHAVNNGADAVFTLRVNAAPTPVPPSPEPSPDSQSGGQ
ncbi:GDSL-type esterase/lipase family protein [uncultured Gemmiger sp.]|uniref:GDSL-type esterase/lipase family protein n=1 Tax=uncultured Gemmiger sp. TaxID=1623490 RepID=UPI0025E0B1FE|nr:GDSL-type esterase/lipase family protein [uncultured Gemmiger sp.]